MRETIIEYSVLLHRIPLYSFERDNRQPKKTHDFGVCNCTYFIKKGKFYVKEGYSVNGYEKRDCKSMRSGKKRQEWY